MDQTADRETPADAPIPPTMDSGWVATQINLDNFPDSPYALEMRQSHWDLRFGDKLEAKFTDVYVERANLRAKVWFSLSLLITVFFAIRRAHDVGLTDLVVLIHLAVLIPCTAILTVLSWSRRLAHLFLPFAKVLAPIYFVGIASLIPDGIARGDNQLAGLTVNVLAVFFFSGLMFRESMMTAITMLGAFGIAAVHAHLKTPDFVQSVAVLVLTSLVGTIVDRDVEKSYRRSFLETALIGELVALDGLTGLMNRRTFDDYLLRMWRHAMRDRQSMVVFMIDIDHFKEYNDAFGHQAGDEALRSVARAIQEAARRPLDIAARYGGEEFAVILYDLPLTAVREVAEHVRQRVQNLQIKRGSTRSASAVITISVGVALVSPTVGRTPDGAVQLADEALYEAKSAGRNNVVVKGIEAYRLLDTGAFKNSSPVSRLQARD